MHLAGGIFHILLGCYRKENAPPNSVKPATTVKVKDIPKTGSSKQIKAAHTDSLQDGKSRPSLKAKTQNISVQGSNEYMNGRSTN